MPTPHVIPEGYPRAFAPSENESIYKTKSGTYHLVAVHEADIDTLDVELAETISGWGPVGTSSIPCVRKRASNPSV